MNNKFSLFNSHPFHEQLSTDEAVIVDKLIKWFSKNLHTAAGFDISDVINDRILVRFMKLIHEQNMHLQTKAWHKFIETFFQKGHVEVIETPHLKNYLLIHYADKHVLSGYLDQTKRIELAYAAIHGSLETRTIFLKNAKHFDLQNQDIMSDLAFKGILLGGANEIELIQFMPLPKAVIQQLVLIIAQYSRVKAEQELKKISPLIPDDHQLILAMIKKM